MATVIRLKRMGSNKKPFFRIVVTDKSSPRDGRFIEELGYYAPLKKDDNFSVDMERVSYWVSKGAVPSETVQNLMKSKSGKKK
ncbi:MAG: 30S ribosomal protein S16 [Candidatus Aureabacteria bacterium]|nr:30S ribosomal protein S16 [Candidatus Auribacterota bacterium]